MKYMIMVGALLGVLSTTTAVLAGETPTPKQLEDAAKAAGSVNGLCPVLGKPVQPNGGSSIYKGEKIAFCCAGCSDKFDTDPVRYMDLLRMNPPKYWYASALPSVTEMRKAKASVKSANGRCPVMGKVVVVTGKSSTYQGQTIQFCCPPCKAKFDKMPEKYMRIMRADPLAYAYDRPGPTSTQLREAREAVGSVNGLCPVMKRLVTTTGGAAVHRDEKIAFCCPGCAKKFQADPDAYLTAMRGEPAIYGYVAAAQK